MVRKLFFFAGLLGVPEPLRCRRCNPAGRADLIRCNPSGGLFVSSSPGGHQPTSRSAPSWAPNHGPGRKRRFRGRQPAGRESVNHRQWSHVPLRRPP